MSLQETPEYNVVITDASCLILLDKIGAFGILHNLFKNVSTTPEVEKEYGYPLPSWISLISAKDIALVEVLKETVDPGEASAIALAIETPNALVILDDLKGRKLAARVAIDYMGTIGMLLKAKEHHIIPLIKPYIDLILNTNFRVSKAVIDYVLEQAGE